MQTASSAYDNAYAKINLYLDIVGKRSDGYHDLCGIMQQISLCDTVEVDYESSDKTTISVLCESDGINVEIPSGKGNIAYRAAEEFLTSIGECAKIDIRIKKNIPSPAGMAGGSADAAAVLNILNRLCKDDKKMSLDDLVKLSEKIGADVPFCLIGGTKTARGIGGMLGECPKLPKCFIVVAIKGEGVKTPWAFGELDKKYDNFSDCNLEKESEKRLSFMLNALKDQDLRGVCDNMFNVFEDVIAGVNGFVSELEEIMKKNGALNAMMSGSGPSVFGIFENSQSAGNACRELECCGAKAFLCKPV